MVSLWLAERFNHLRKVLENSHSKKINFILIKINQHYWASVFITARFGDLL